MVTAAACSSTPEVRTIETTVRTVSDTTGLKPAQYDFSMVVEGQRLDGPGGQVVSYTETVSGNVSVLSPELVQFGGCRKNVEDKQRKRVSYISIDCGTRRITVRQVAGTLVDGTLAVRVSRLKQMRRVCTAYETDPQTGRQGRCISYENRPEMESTWFSRSVALNPSSAP
jgi:hypothetical protein